MPKLTSIDCFLITKASLKDTDTIQCNTLIIYDYSNYFGRSIRQTWLRNASLIYTDKKHKVEINVGQAMNCVESQYVTSTKSIAQTHLLCTKALS